MGKFAIYAVLAVVYFFACASLLFGMFDSSAAAYGGGVLGAIAMLKCVYPKF